MLIRVRLGGAPPAALITFSQPQKTHRTAHMGAKKQSLENLEKIFKMILIDKLIV